MIETWELKRSANYGSDRHDERRLGVQSVTVSGDGKTVDLRIPDIAPTWTLQIAYKLRDTSGQPVGRVLQGTIQPPRQSRRVD